MDENLKYETYLSIGKKKIIISVITEKNDKIYEDEINLNNQKITQSLDQLDEFLNNNIFKIEKKIKDFVKKIFVVVDSQDLLNVQVSIKEKSFQ